MAKKKYLLDTCICVYLLRGKYRVAQRIDEVGLENCYISEMTIAELKFGERLGRMKNNAKYRNQHLDAFIDAINVLRVEPAFDLYAEEKARLQLNGTPADDDFDLLIGCTAVIRKMVMVTENIKDFKNIAGMQLENWVER